MDTYEDVVVVYHHPCLDGMASRYAAWKLFGDNATYIPGKYEEELDIEIFKDKHVICVDFSYEYDDLMAIAKVAETVNIYDHHKTAKPDVEKAQKDSDNHIGYMYDADLSGAGIVWSYLGTYPQLMHGEPLPKLPDILAHIQDRDLWKFEIDYTKEVCCYMVSLDYDFEKWVHAIEQERYADVVAKGSVIRCAEIKEITDIVRGAELGELFGYDIPVLTDCPKHYISEACNRLLTEMYRKGERVTHGEGKSFWPFTANRSRIDGGWLYSMRSNEHGIDVGALAKSQGGGGHRNAAGFFKKDP